MSLAISTLRNSPRKPYPKRSPLEKNLAVLAERQPALAKRLRALSESIVEIFPARSGLPTARYRRESGETILLHSQYDPRREALTALQQCDVQDGDAIIVVGLGLGYIMDALIESRDLDRHSIFIVEPNLAILRSALESRDCTHWLKTPQLHLAWPTTSGELASQWKGFFDPVRAPRNVFIPHAPSFVLDEAALKNAGEIIQSQTYQIVTDINTLVVKSKTFLENFIVNLRAARSAPGMVRFMDKFVNTPALIVSAGPSLDRNIHELRNVRDQALILAVDTAVKPLLAAGVEPHFVLTGDPTYENYLHLRGAKLREGLVVAEATAHPGVFAEFEGGIVSCVYDHSSLSAFSQLLEDKGALRAWGSIATMALDFALKLGCNPIVFVGQDLAHSENRSYCTGLQWEEKSFLGVSSPQAWELRWEEIRESKRRVLVEDIYGNPVDTTDKLSAYWNWIEKEIREHTEVVFVNATEGGILRNHVKLMSLREAIFRFCDTDRHLRPRIAEIFNHNDDCFPVAGPTPLDLLHQESNQVRTHLDRSLAYCKDPADGEVEVLVRNLDALKEGIYSTGRIAGLLDCFNQLGNVRFLRRQSTIPKLPATRGLSAEIREIYGEYFESVREAHQVIDAALVRIDELSN